MGILRGTARLLLDEHRRRPFSGSLLELGKMFVFFTDRELEKWAEAHKVELARTDIALSHHPPLARRGCLDDRSFFKRLGFDEVKSSDVARWEGADILWDLNQPPPADLTQRFDVVFEGGTLQHVFDLPQVFRNIHAVLEPGGRIIHGVCPSNNHVDLGFYMFSPTLFYDFYSANGWEINSFYFFDYIAYWVAGRLETSPWRIYRYEPGCLDALSYGRIGNRQVGLFIVATKTAEATADVVPQQGFYRDLWRKVDEAKAPPSPVPAATLDGWRPGGYKALAAWKYVRELVRRFGPKKMPPVVARY